MTKIHRGATDTPFDENSKALRFTLTQVCSSNRPNMKLVRSNPWEEFAEVQRLEIGQLTFSVQNGGLPAGLASMGPELLCSSW